MKKISHIFACSLISIFATSCSDNSSSVPENLDENNVSETSSGTLFVFGSNYESGELRFVNEDGKLSNEKLDFYQDAKLYNIEGVLFVLEGLGADNVSKVEFKNGKMNVVWQEKIKDCANPVEIVYVGENRAWIACQGSSAIYQISTENGNHKKTIDTKDFAKDGISPYVSSIETSGDTLFAVFQRYTTNAETWEISYPKGLLAMYSLDDGKLLDTMTLAQKNPMKILKAGEEIFIASRGEYNGEFGHDADAFRGIEILNREKKISSMYLTGEDLGGGIINLTADEKTLFAAVYIAFGNSFIAKIDLENKAIEKINVNVEGSFMVNKNDGTLAIGDRNYGAENLVLYKEGEIEIVEVAKDFEGTPLPPYSITFLND